MKETFTEGQAAHLAALRASLAEVQDLLSLPQLVALLCVGIEPGLSVNELAERMGIPQQTASRYASVLLGRYDSPSSTTLKEPLLVQGVSQRDPRSRTLHLTDAGRDVLVQLAASLNINS